MTTLELHTRRAALASNTFDADARTVEVVFSTGASVQRHGYVEALEMSADAVDLSRFIGAPVLDSHRQGSLADQIGVVTSARVENGQGIATIKFSERAAAIMSDVCEGILRHVSVGYRVTRWRESNENGQRVKTGTRWQPLELSLVSVPADPGAIIRSSDMENETTTPEAPANPEAVQTRASMSELRTIQGLHNLPESWIDAQVEANATRQQATDSANEEVQVRTAAIPPARVGVSHEDPNAIMQRQIGGYVAAATGSSPEDSEREFASLSTMQHLREMLERRGVATRRMSDHDIIARSFGTGDAPEFFTGVGNRTVLAAYARERSPIMDLTVTKTVPDYRPNSFLRDGDFDGDLEEVSENGEWTRTSFSESKITTQVRDFARGFDLTERAIRNDDKGVTTRIPDKFGAMAAAKDAELVAGIISTNPIVDDGFNLFDASNHGNYDASDTPISEESVSAGRLAMRSLVGLDGETLLDIRPRYLVVGKALETTAEKFLATITPTTTSNVNPFAGKLSLIVEPRIGDYEWLLAADPRQAPVLAVLRLSGQEAPRIEQETMWNTFGVSYRCKHTVNATAIGWRGLALWANGQDSNSEV